MDGITAHTETRPTTRLDRARARLTRWMAAAVAGVSRAAINRRVVGQLSRMSDRDLKDIGLVRQDVLDSQTLLLEGDAANFLVGRREERRRARHPVPAGRRPASFGARC